MPSESSKQLNKQVNTKTQAINEKENSIVQGEPTIKVPNYKKNKQQNSIKLFKKIHKHKVTFKNIIKNKSFKNITFFKVL